VDQYTYAAAELSLGECYLFGIGVGKDAGMGARLVATAAQVKNPVPYTLYTLCSILYISCILYSIYPVFYTLYTLYPILYIPCILYSIYPVSYTLHTLYPILYIPYIIFPIAYTSTLDLRS
jgi:hypothetical protein